MSFGILLLSNYFLSSFFFSFAAICFLIISSLFLCAFLSERRLCKSTKAAKNNANPVSQ